MPNDELEIVKRAREAAERVMKRIPREAWDAVRRAGEISDRFRLVPQHALGRIMEQAQHANQRMNEMVRSFSRPVIEVVDVFRSPQMQDLIRRAQEAFARLPAVMRNTLHTLGMNGWYPDDEMDMAQLVDYASGFDTGEEDKTNETLCQHFEKRSEAIINDLIAMAPTREKPLRCHGD